MNTRFSYMYRDAANYKEAGEVIFSGTWTNEQEQRLLKALDGGEYFIASQLGVPEAFFAEETEHDHPWHEFEFLESTDKSPTDPRSFEEFVQTVEKVSNEGWIESSQKAESHT